jgi:hypothetical protein
MVLDSGELERIADDIYKDRIITGTLYCGNCGYNLHGLPYVHICPECGNRYNARPRAQRGIFSPTDADFPLGDILLTLLGVVLTVVVVWGGMNPLSYAYVLFGIAFGIVTLGFGFRACLRLSRCHKTRTIARRITMQED